MRQRCFFRRVWRSHTFALALTLSATAGWAQQSQPRAATANALEDSVRELQAQVRELKSLLLEMRAETTSYRAENLQMRRELEAAHAQLAARAAPAPGSAAENPSAAPVAPERSGAAAPPNNDERVAKLEEEYQLLSGKIDEQYQTKVESASKYRVRLSGIVLMNLFTNRGTVDNLDSPALAMAPGTLDSGGSFGASLRQSQLGLEVFGAEVAGARAAADVQLDFAGGFPNALNGVSFGVVRLRTATLRLDWPRTSLVAGQDALFFSPGSPTSLASLAVPALSYAGNLWAWTPQVRIEHRLALPNDSGILLQGGILDPLTGDPPSTLFLRSAQPGERSRQPGYAARIAWNHGDSDRKFTVGVGGYYSRELWGFGRTVDGWAGMADWSLPVFRWFTLTGKFYHGRAIGGLGAGFNRSVLLTGPLSDPATSVQGLNSTGGWAQLKFKATATVEFNTAWGQENPLARDLRRFPVNPNSPYPSAARNRSEFVNIIYRPRSDLVLSAEYRRLRTFELRGGSRTADHINLMMGILF